MYADDTSLYKAAKSVSAIVAALQPDLIELSNWVSANRLVMNVLKTKCMLFGTARKLALLPDKSLNLVIGSEKVEQVIEAVLLGLHMDPSLTWNLHTKYLVTKLSGNLAYVRRYACYIPDDVCKLVLQALVLSVVQYCSPLLASMSDSNMRKLQIVQNRACRLLLKCTSDTSVRRMHLELGWPTVRKRFSLLYNKYFDYVLQNPH